MADQKSYAEQTNIRNEMRLRELRAELPPIAELSFAASNKRRLRVQESLTQLI